MDRIHPHFEDEDLEVTLKTDDSDSDVDAVFNALYRTIEDLDVTFDIDEALVEDSETEPTMAAEATFAWLADELKRN